MVGVNFEDGFVIQFEGEEYDVFYGCFLFCVNEEDDKEGMVLEYIEEVMVYGFKVLIIIKSGMDLLMLELMVILEILVLDDEFMNEQKQFGYFSILEKLVYVVF